MCGLAGFFAPAAQSSEEELLTTIHRMTATLRHRGPDGDGAWADPASGIALGFRRLAIIDLSPTGDQPMRTRDGRYTIVYNGEIYNFRELRRELEAAGHTFRGHSDTEVILEGVAAWGIGATLRRLIGMFAIALWDGRLRTLTLARDRLGIKPLYWGRAGSTLVFASELKALRGHAGFAPTIDRGALAAYLRLLYVPGPHTIYGEASKLMPGHVLTVSSDGAEHLDCYWDVAQVAREGVLERERTSAGEREAVDALDALLRDAVGRRMVADVPLGAFLSGGVDSSLVVALMQAQSTNPVRTFAIGFDDPRYDEARHAAAVAAHLGTQHTQLYVEPRHALEVIPRLPRWYDEPFADSSQIPTYLVSELARCHVTVALSGDGGDEVFAGYGRYLWGRRMGGGNGPLLRPLRRLLAAGLRAVPDTIWDDSVRLLPPRLRPRPLRDRARRFAATLAATGPDAVYRRLITYWDDPATVVLGATEARVAALTGPLPTELTDPVERMQLLDLLTYLPDDILTKVDRASMAVSLEARVPLLDHRVVELAWRMPPAMKLRGSESKWALRQVLDRYVPRALVERPKMGFSIPLDSWLRGPLRDWAETLLAPARLRSEGFFDPRPIRERWTRHLDGRSSGEHHIWSVLMFQAWLEQQASTD